MAGDLQSVEANAGREPYSALLPLFERQLDEACRTGGLSSEEAARFGGWAKRRLFEDHAEILRRQTGSTRSSPASYFSVLVQCLLLEFRAVPEGQPGGRPAGTIDR